MKGDKNFDSKAAFLDQWSIILFLICLIFLISMWDIHIFLTDEKPLVNQLVNLQNGSLSLEKIKIPLDGAWYFQKDDAIYSVYSHAVPVFSMPVYLILYKISFFVNIVVFFIFLWSALVILLGHFLSKKFNNPNIFRLCAVVSVVFLAMNFLLYEPVSFYKWGEMISMQFFNIIITSIAVVLIYLLFKGIFNESSGLFAALIFLFATPYAFWGVGVKEHALSTFLALASFLFFYNYLTTSNARFAYLAYGLTGLVAWARIFDALPLFFSIYTVDVLFVQRFLNWIPDLQQVKSFLKHSMKIFFVMIVALLPYFINNYLIIGNPFFFVGYGPRSEISVQAPMKITSFAAFSNYSLNILDTLRVIPDYFSQYWSILGLDVMFANAIRLFYYSDISIKSSVFQINPLLSVVLPISIIFTSKLIKAFKKQKKSCFKDMKTKIKPMDMLFVLLVILIFIFYFPFDHRYGDGYSYDYRYFILLYIPLIYFTLRTLNVMFPSYVENNFSSIVSLFLTGSYTALFFSTILLFFFFQPGFQSVITLIKSISVIYISLISTYLVFYIFRGKEEHLKYIISMCLSLSFLWVFMANFLGRSDVFDRGVGMMLPVSQYINEFLRLVLISTWLR